MTVPFRIVIPARFASSRLPGKILADIVGKPMVQHVYEKARQTSAKSVVIATEHPDVIALAKKIGADVCLTAPSHPSGTDRVAEVTHLLNYDLDEIVVNVQGDQPFVPPENIEQVAKNLWQRPQVDIATICERIHEHSRLHNPSVAKVVIDAQGHALYFSRSLVPWSQETQINLLQQEYYQHVGLYAYRVETLQQFVNWPACPLEQMESLEQLRALWYGQKIHVDLALKPCPPEVNTPDDLQLAQQFYASSTRA